MRWRKQVRISREGLELAADVNAAIVVNSGEPDADRTAEASSHLRIVQRTRGARAVATPDSASAGASADAGAGARRGTSASAGP